MIEFYLLPCLLIDLALGRTFCSPPLHSPPTVIDAPREVKRNIEEEGKAMNNRTRTLKRIRKRALDASVPKDIDTRLDEIQAEIDTLNETLGKRLDETNRSLQALDMLLRARTDRTAWTWLLGGVS